MPGPLPSPLAQTLGALRARLGGALRTPIVLAAVLVFAVDRVMKLVIVYLLDLPAVGRMEVMPPFLNFVMEWNRGINFGLFSNAHELMRWGLIVISVAISAVLAWWARRRASVPIAWGAGLVIGGALGNAWDRVQYGAVADFLNMSCCGIANPFAFNVADIAIFCGAVLIAWKT